MSRRWIHTLAALAALTFPALALPGTLAADVLVSDLSEKNIEIRYSFAGANLLLFGAITDPAVSRASGHKDIVVVLRGPRTPGVVRRKERVGGIWINTRSLEFMNAPGYYAVASTRPLDDITDSDLLDIHEIGSAHLQLAVDENIVPEDYIAFRDGFIRGKTRDGLYFEEAGNIEVRDETLFRTDIRLPSNVPVGQYMAEVYLFHDGTLLSSDAVFLQVDKSGFERIIYNFAQEQPALYGLMAILIALASGWVAGLVGRQ